MVRNILLVLAAVAAWGQSLPPVVLVNGYQVPPCENASVDGTFGQLAQKLRDAGREVVPFNNCSVAGTGGARPSIEALGTALGTRIAALPGSQVDIVAHSMGGLIVRAYLSGKQAAPGTFQPPANPKVRKVVFLGTPHYGPGLGPLLLQFGGSDLQVRALLPGSQFIADLATWNQKSDDLRGVDSVSVIGSVQNVGDGLVLVPSAANPVETLARTRVVPYCHTDVGILALVSRECARPPFLAFVNSDDHMSWRIIRSFLWGTDDWKTIGTTLAADSAGSRQSGLTMVVRDKDDNVNNSVTRITSGPNALVKITDYFYGEFLPAGLQLLTVTDQSGPANLQVSLEPGTHAVAIVKPGPNAGAVLPAAGAVATRTLAPGMFVSIYGSALATSSGSAASLPLPTTLSGAQVLNGSTPLGLIFAGPSQINAIVPDDATGLLTLTVKTNDGTSKLNILLEPAVPAIFTQSGTGTGVASAIQALSGAIITAQAPVMPGDAVSLYLTGLGSTETRNNLQWARIVPKVFLGDAEAQVLYAGRAPGYAGLDQINFIVPSGGTAKLRVESNGRVSNVVDLPRP